MFIEEQRKVMCMEIKPMYSDETLKTFLFKNHFMLRVFAYHQAWKIFIDLKIKCTYHNLYAFEMPFYKRVLCHSSCVKKRWSVVQKQEDDRRRASIVGMA